MSNTLRRSASRPAALAGAAVLVLLAACSGDGGGAADSSAAGNQAAESPAAAGGDDEFCSRAAGIDQQVESALADLDGADPSVADAFGKVAEELRSIDPPAEIASDWDALAGGLDEMSGAFADFDLTDPDSLAALEGAQGELTTASDNVEAYLRDQCGIEP